MARRPLWRSLVDAVVFLVASVLVLAAARQAGVLPGGEHSRSGRFIAVDGDSLRQGDQNYRLHAIDAPELSQTCQRADSSNYPCGREARAELARLIGSGRLDCRIVDTDHYQRFVAECRAGSVNINDAMVRSGWAIAYRRHGGDYASAETEARRSGRGIWQGPFQAPEDWRNARRTQLQRGSLLSGALPDD